MRLFLIGLFSLCLSPLATADKPTLPRGTKAKAGVTVTKGTKAAKGPASIVAIETTKGVIKIQLFRKKAPITTANFLKYARTGFYNGTIFHRVIKNFMIQGGGVTRMMKRKPTTKMIRNEADNGLSNQVGTLAMARTGKPHSASAQFFINTKHNEALDHRGKTQQAWGYCVFAKVIEGMKVVRAIEGAFTTTRAGRRNVPMTAIVIKKVYVVK